MRSMMQGSRPGVLSPAISVPMLLAASVPCLANHLNASLDFREHLLADVSAPAVLSAGTQAINLTPSSA